MSLPYWLRLLGVCSGAGFLAYAAGCVLAQLAGREWLGRLERRRLSWREPAGAARLALHLRLLPLWASLVVMFGFCLPSYLWLEQRTGGESAGAGFYVAGMAGLVLAVWAGCRLAGALVAAWTFQRRCRANGAPWQAGAAALGWDAGEAMMVTGDAPPMALAGVLRPTLLVSRQLLATLPREQMEAGLRHERGHVTAHDNFKRLLLAATPRLWPGGALLRLETTWARLAEWAADDCAAAGQGGGTDPRRSLALAAALVHCARLGLGPCTATPVSMLATAADASGAVRDLAERVQRLLAERPNSAGERPVRWRWAPWVAATLALAAMAQPTTLHAVHALLELLVH